MSDLFVYIENRKKKDSEFEKSFETGCDKFKVGLLLKELRKKEEMTQEELKIKLKTKKNVISWMENHTEDIRLSTISKVAEVFGKKSKLRLNSKF